MTLSYNGQNSGKIECYNYEELIQACENGDWFRTSRGDPFYYRSIMFSSYKNVVVPDNLFCFRRVCINARTIKYRNYYTIEKSENKDKKIYTGKDLENLICTELKQWIRDLNPKTLKAFGGCSFPSYIAAIPKEILLNNDFYERLKETAEQAFVLRKNGSSGEEKSILAKVEDYTNQSIDQKVSEKKVELGKVEDAVLNIVETRKSDIRDKNL